MFKHQNLYRYGRKVHATKRRSLLLVLVVVVSFHLTVPCNARSRRACRKGCGDIGCCGSSAGTIPFQDQARRNRDSVADLAQRIQRTSAITLATTHISGQFDQATANLNIQQAAAGQEAQRSSYGNAPGGSTPLQANMLNGMLQLAQTYSIQVTEVAGGSHSANSRHYVGTAFDINVIDGAPVNAGHPELDAFKQACKSFGATEVLGPGDPGHDTHVHAAWPRPVQ